SGFMSEKRWLLWPLIVNLLLLIPFLAICLVPFVSSGISWLLSTFGLGFPYLLLLLILLLIFWIRYFRRRIGQWMALVNIVAILLSYTQIRAAIGFHFFADTKIMERAGDIR